MKKRAMGKRAMYVRIKNQWRAAGNPTATLRTMLEWGAAHGLYKVDAAAALSRDVREFAEALRTEQTTVEGEEVRANYCYPSAQGFLWDELITIPRDNMRAALQVQRRGLVAEGRAMKRSAHAWSVVHADEEPLELALGYFNLETDLGHTSVPGASSSEIELPIGPPPLVPADSQEPLEPTRPPSPRVRPRRRHEGSFLADAPPPLGRP